MPILTPKLGIKKPLGNETVIRTFFNENWDIIDKEVMCEPFLLEEPTYETGNNHIVCIIGSGLAEIFSGDARIIVEKDANTTYYINAPTVNATYYLYLQVDGTFTHNTTGIILVGAALLWRVATGASVSDLTKIDQRAQISGVGTKLAAHLAETTTGAHKAKNIALEDAGGYFVSLEVEGALSELFTSVSDGKTQVASAVTDMGQAATGSDTFTQLATKIRDISDDATAAVGDVLTTKTFYQGGAKRTGNMANKVGSATVITPGTADQTIPQGYYGGTAGDGKVVGDTDLVAANIKKDVNIFSMVGAFTGIVSIQQGSITIPINQVTATTAITEVTPSNSIIICNGQRAGNQGMLAGHSLARVELTNGTTVTATRGVATDFGTCIVSYIVVEFSSAVVNSKKSGTIAIPSGSVYNVAAITAVNVAKSFFAWCGSMSNDGQYFDISHIADIWLNSSTQVRTQRLWTSGILTMGWNLLEFK